MCIRDRSNTGFVSEMKSVISEMLQYDIKPDVMQDAAGAAYSDSEGSAALQESCGMSLPICSLPRTQPGGRHDPASPALPYL